MRMALVDLDQPPCWWKNAPGDTISAREARKLAGTTGSCWRCMLLLALAQCPQ